MQFHLPSTNVLIKALGSIGIQPGSVVVPPFMSVVICICIQSLHKLSVSLMRSLMRCSPWTSNQGQGLRRIMKSPISFHSMQRFSLLHSTDAYGILYYPQLHSYPTQQRQHNSADKKRHFRLTRNTDQCHLVQLLSCGPYYIAFQFIRVNLHMIGNVALTS